MPREQSPVIIRVTEESKLKRRNKKMRKAIANAMIFMGDKLHLWEQGV